MTTLVIAILRIGGLIVAVLGVIGLFSVLSAFFQTLTYQYGGGFAPALLILLTPLYTVVAGAALYGFAEVIALLMQIRDRADA